MNKSLLFFLSAFFMFLALSSHSQKGQPLAMDRTNAKSPYAAQWKTIDSLENEGLPKSAYAALQKLIEQIDREKEPAECIKALIYRAKYLNALEEDGMVVAIEDLQKELAQSQFPIKPVLQSLIAELYTNYRNGYFILVSDRTQTTDEFVKTDLRTWDLSDFIEESNRLYWASLSDERIKDVPIELFNELMEFGRYNEGVRPTLFDFLAHRAMKHFMDGYSYLTEPNYKFEIDQPVYFSSATTFIDHTVQTKDTSSGYYKALLLYQQLLDFHIKSANEKARIIVDIDRLKFVRQYGTLDNKNELYLKALLALREEIKDNPDVTEIIFAIAEHYKTWGSIEGQKDPSVAQMDWKLAVDLCQSAIDQYPDTRGTKACRRLMAEIQQKNLSLSAANVQPSNTPILAALYYRNIPKVYLRVIRIDERTRQALLPKTEKDQLDFYRNAKVLQSWSLDLPQTEDYHPHHTEIKIDTLPLGQYMVLLSDHPDFSLDRQFFFNYLPIWISDLAFWNGRGADYNADIMVTDRTTGAPLDGVQAVFYADRRYNSRKKIYESKKLGEAVSDKDGRIRSGLAPGTSFKTKLIKGQDTLYSDELVPNYRKTDYGRTQFPTTHFFLDRAIYRPGQTIYYKILAVSFDQERIPQIAKKESITVQFIDANQQVVATQEVLTNEYGTASGYFIAPEGGLLGQMSIQSSYGRKQHYFRVEEYKRPKFEVKLLPVTESYRLGDQVKVKGAATAFAGNNIDGAEVQYRVVRKVSYPYLPWYWRRSYYDRDQMEIANGRTTTDENGQFSIEFEAIPNAAIPAKDKPQFRYEILADVTDINGETQSTSGQVIVGYIALQIGIDLPEKVNRDSLRSLTINSLNLNNEFEGAKGKIRIEALQSPGKVFRKRLWQEPDQYLMTKEEFEADFPNDVYKKEDQPHTWPIANSVYAVRFNTNKNKELELDPATWPIGHYKLTLLSKDKYGQEVKLERLFILYDLDDQTLPSGEKLFNQLDKPSYEPGMLAKLTLGAEKSTQVFYELIHNEQIIEKRWLQVKDMQSLRFPIVEAYRGNLHYRLTYVLDNRFNTSLSTIIVPWTNKDLKFEYLSFRDQLQPGAAEEWQIKISGMQKDRLAAEMVATLYDASLDQFTPHNWQMSLYPQAYTSGSWQSGNFNLMSARLFNSYRSINYGSTIHRQYRRLKWFNFGRYGKAYRRTSNRMLSITQDNVAGMAQPEAMMDAAVPSPVNAQAKTEAYSYEADEGGSTKDPKSDNANPVRTNLKETVFFIPDLQTDAEGNILLKFKMNEALTRWNFMGMAHTQALEYGFTRNEVITQKELMVQPNAPRFLREGDEIEFTAKVSNLTEATINGQAELQLFDALSMQPVDELLGNTQREINFSAAAGQSDRLAWRLKIPEGKVMAITHRVIARAGSYADGEESSLPVLTNRMMVTESLPLPVSGKESKTFVFKGLEEKSASSTLKHHRYTLEFTSNPAWYAVQALPYMMEYPYQCTEQVFNRFYANSLATSVANAHPKIKRVFEAWKNADALQSNLSKNQALKSALIEETPWVLQAQSEAVQKKNIGLLFDLNRMSREQDKALNTLLERQQPDGSFSWFPGGRGNWYITQYLVEGMGHLDALGTGDLTQNDKAFGLLKRAIQFIDQKIVDHYERLEERLQKKDKGKLSDNHLDQMAIHYLYARSFFADLAFTGRSREVRDYYLGQAEKYWLGKGNYLEGMLALALHRFGQQTVPAKIIASLRERAMRSEELGMYWKSELGYYWYQLPIEQHALMIELFDEVAGDAKAVNDLKVWLLKNKQTTHWQTTKATSAAVYALLRRGNNWLLEDQLVKIEVGGQKVATDQLTVEAGTGYFKTSWKGEEVNKEMSTIKVENPNEVVAWGGVYWQYFEQLDKITSFEETPLKLKKQLFLEKRSDKGPVLQPIDESVDLKPGDKLKVRIELRVDRAMEYVHLKDMRASGLEPINVLSQYKWQGGLGYYESTRDLLTSFFFDYLPKGTFVFEYPLRVSHTGNFSNGISTIQCMYAPEFSSHSEGIRLEVGEK